jgi:hypothetical protein
MVRDDAPGAKASPAPSITVMVATVTKGDAPQTDSVPSEP